MNHLRVLEMDYSVSPGGTNEFEVYSLDPADMHNPPLFSSEDLLEAISFCYGAGVDFEVKTLAQYYREEEATWNEYHAKKDNQQLSLPF